MAFSCICHLYFVVITLSLFRPSCPLFADSPSPPPIIVSSTFMSYVSCCFSGLRFRSAPMAGEELQPHGRNLTQEAEALVQSKAQCQSDQRRRELGGARGALCFGCSFVIYPFPSTSCHPSQPLALPPFWTFVLPLSNKDTRQGSNRQFKSFATFIF